MPIYKGSEGVKLPITIRSNNAPMDLTGATVDLLIKTPTGTTTKTTIPISEASKGKCYYILTASDLATAGTYSVQAVVKYSDGRKFPGTIKEFTVEEGL